MSNKNILCSPTRAGERGKDLVFHNLCHLLTFWLSLSLSLSAFYLRAYLFLSSAHETFLSLFLSLYLYFASKSGRGGRKDGKLLGGDGFIWHRAGIFYVSLSLPGRGIWNEIRPNTNRFKKKILYSKKVWMNPMIF